MGAEFARLLTLRSRWSTAWGEGILEGLQWIDKPCSRSQYCFLRDRHGVWWESQREVNVIAVWPNGACAEGGMCLHTVQLALATDLMGTLGVNGLTISTQSAIFAAIHPTRGV